MRILTFSSPPLTVSTAHMLTIAFALTYVGSIYFSKAARLSFSRLANKPQRNTNGWPTEREKGSNERWRDDPDVIRARLVAVSSATLACCLFFFGLVWSLVRPSEYVSPKVHHLSYRFHVVIDKWTRKQILPRIPFLLALASLTTSHISYPISQLFFFS
jgi:hypothetical protein